MDVNLADVAGPKVPVIDALSVRNGSCFASRKRVRSRGIVAGLGSQRGAGNNLLVLLWLGGVDRKRQAQRKSQAGSGDNFGHQSTPARLR